MPNPAKLQGRHTGRITPMARWRRDRLAGDLQFIEEKGSGIAGAVLASRLDNQRGALHFPSFDIFSFGHF
jgi:hypothetical protein